MRLILLSLFTLLLLGNWSIVSYAQSIRLDTFLMDENASAVEGRRQIALIEPPAPIDSDKLKDKIVVYYAPVNINFNLLKPGGPVSKNKDGVYVLNVGDKGAFKWVIKNITDYPVTIENSKHLKIHKSLTKLFELSKWELEYDNKKNSHFNRLIGQLDTGKNQFPLINLELLPGHDCIIYVDFKVIDTPE